MARVDMDRTNPSDMTQDASALAFSLSIREALEQWLGMRRGMGGRWSSADASTCLGPRPRSALASLKYCPKCNSGTRGWRSSGSQKLHPLCACRGSLQAPGFAPEPLQEPDCKLKVRDAHFLLPAPYLAGRAHLQPQHQAMVRDVP